MTVIWVMILRLPRNKADTSSCPGLSVFFLENVILRGLDTQGPAETREVTLFSGNRSVTRPSGLLVPGTEQKSEGVSVPWVLIMPSLHFLPQDINLI